MMVHLTMTKKIIKNDKIIATIPLATNQIETKLTVAISTKLKTITKTSQKIQFIKTSFHLYYTINLFRKKEAFFSFF